MVIVISESQLPRMAAMNWLMKFTKDFRRVVNDDSIKVLSNDDEVIFEFDKKTNTLYIDYSRVWSFIYHQMKFSKEDSLLIIRAFAIDFLGFKELKYSGKMRLKNLNDFSKEYSLTETENPPSEPPLSKPLDMNLIFQRNPILQKVIPQKDTFLKTVGNLPADEQLKKLTGLLNQKNPNFNAKSSGGMLSFDMKNPFVNQNQQMKYPIRLKGNADISIFPKPKLNNVTFSLTIPLN